MHVGFIIPLRYSFIIKSVRETPATVTVGNGTETIGRAEIQYIAQGSNMYRFSSINTAYTYVQSQGHVASQKGLLVWSSDDLFYRTLKILELFTL